MEETFKDQLVCSKQLVTEAFVGAQFSKLDHSVPNSDTYGHFLLTFAMSNCLIVITVFHRFDNYFWVEKLHLENEDHTNYLTFGTTSRQIFDLFELEKIKLNEIFNVDILVPVNRWHFLSEIATANYIGCNSEVAKKLQLPPATMDFRNSALNGIRSIKSLTKVMRLPIWIMCGTLLGWYRECDIIGHTTDFDFATWGDLAHDNLKSNVQRTIERTRSSISLYLTFGYPKNGYELAFLTPSKTKFDLFFTYDGGPDFWITTGHLVSSRSYFRYLYPKFKLCSTSLLGEKVLVPCDPLPVIEAEYGLTWKVPIKNWHFYSSAKNVGIVEKWPNNYTGFYWINSSLQKVKNKI